MENLARAVRVSARTIVDASQELNREAEEARRAVEKFRADVETYERVARLKEEEAEAIVRVVQAPIKREGIRSLFLNIAISLIGLIAGLLLGQSN